MVRKRDDEVAAVYEVARAWAEAALGQDDSLFTPGVPIWSSRWLDELHERFVGQPDASGDAFDAKLRRQLREAPAECFQLMGEVLYVHFLIAAPGAIGGDRKREIIRQVLGWSPKPADIPSPLAAALDGGIAHPGTGFQTYRPFMLAYVIEVARALKSRTEEERRSILGDPWPFKAFLMSISADKAYSQRLALLHLVHPDTFEPITSMDAKTRIVKAFADHVEDSQADVDRNLARIRERLSTRFGEGFNFYAPEIKGLWHSDASRWGQFISWARRLYELETFEEDERTYKLGVAELARRAREAVLTGDLDWPERLKAALQNKDNNLTDWHVHDTFVKWCASDRDAALSGLRAIWEQGSSTESRVRAFVERVPGEVLTHSGARLAMASFLLLAVDPTEHAIHRVEPFRKGYKLTGYPEPPKDADDAGRYLHGLEFLDRIAAEASSRGLELTDRLDAQGVLWAVVKGDGKGLSDEELERLCKYRGDEPGTTPPDITCSPLAQLAAEVLLPPSFLERIQRLLEDKGQVVFHGPPGTGKTFVAQEFARILTGDEAAIELVQFHPSYAYEDFVEGYRPAKLEGGQPGFLLREGALKRIAKRATDHPGRPHVLIIDELNRGNLAKVFGELYFLLEYRRRDIRLQYSEDLFSLPENLYIIGTMNSADRSIAMVDAALRRRFHFVPFFPDEAPIQGLLSRWLEKNKPDLSWVAGVLDEANKRLEDRNLAIGPSHFLRPDLDEAWVELIWEHSILPYMAEQLFGQEDRLSEFSLTTLRSAVGA